MQNRFFSLILIIALTACSSSPSVIPQVNRPAEAPFAVKKPPMPAPVIADATALSGDWTDWPITEGSWVYRSDDRGSIALFGRVQSDALVTVRCDKSRARIYLARAGTGGGEMTVRSSSALKTFNASPTGGTPAYVAAEIQPNDPFLDAMIYTRGRIALQVAGQQSIAVPIWSEIAKVVEDCRS
jgi:hypothetical protein